MSQQPSAIEGRSRSSIRVREWLVAISAGATLAFTAWGLGGVQMWTLHVLLVGGLFTLSSAVINVRFSKFPYLSLSNQTLRRLISWPPFWFSFLFLLYLLIGALNPAAEVVRDERGWWVEAVQAPLATWLPTSVRSDYQPMNAWRVLASFVAAFTLIWGLWAGLTQRKPILLVLWCLLLSGAVMGLAAILQHLTEAKAVLWTFPSSNRNFWGSFFYRNQAAAYLNLILIASGVLFFYHAKRTREFSRSGGPHFLCFVFFALTAASIGLALSRGGILICSILIVCYLVLLVLFGLQSIPHLRSFWLSILPVFILGLGALLAVSYINFDAIYERFGDLGKAIETGDQEARAISTKASWDMAQDRLALGWGGGSFRYIFPMYQRNYPEIHYARYHMKKGWVGRKMYNYAHNDIVQFVAEYGAIGSALVLLTLLWILFSAFRIFSFSAFFLLVGFATSISNAFFDFIFNSPAYWMAFLSLLVASSKLLQMEAARKRCRREMC
jgi:O-antigen ligase